MELKDKDWLTYKEACSFIKCKRTKLFELLKFCNLKKVQIGNKFLIERRSIENYLSSNIKRRDYYGKD